MVARRIGNELSRNAIANMRRLRQARGMSAQKLCDAMNNMGFDIHPTTLRNQESRPEGKYKHMTLDQAVWVSRTLGITVDELVSEYLCESCNLTPPPGFSCNECGRGAA